MPVQMRGKKVAVEKQGKSGGSKDSLFALPEDTTSCGVILYVGPDVGSDLKVGQKVYFGDKRQQLRIEGKDLQVMEEDNVLAVASS